MQAQWQMQIRKVKGERQEEIILEYTLRYVDQQQEYLSTWIIFVLINILYIFFHTFHILKKIPKQETIFLT